MANLFHAHRNAADARQRGRTAPVEAKAAIAALDNEASLRHLIDAYMASHGGERRGIVRELVEAIAEQGSDRVAGANGPSSALRGAAVGSARTACACGEQQGLRLPED